MMLIYMVGLILSFDVMIYSFSYGKKSHYDMSNTSLQPNGLTAVAF